MSAMNEETKQAAERPPEEVAANAILAILEPSFGAWTFKDKAVAQVIKEAYNQVLAELDRAQAQIADHERRMSSLWRWCEHRRIDERDDQTIESMLDDLYERLSTRYEAAEQQLATADRKAQADALEASKALARAAGALESLPVESGSVWTVFRKCAVEDACEQSTKQLRAALAPDAAKTATGGSNA